MLLKIFGVLLLPVITFGLTYLLLVQIGMAQPPGQLYCPTTWVQIVSYEKMVVGQPQVLAEYFLYRSGHQQQVEPIHGQLVEVFCELEPKQVNYEDFEHSNQVSWLNISHD